MSAADDPPGDGGPGSKPPWARLRPLPVLFVIGLFVFLWVRRPPPAASGGDAPTAQASAADEGDRAHAGRKGRPDPGLADGVTAELSDADGEPLAVLGGAVMGTRWNAKIVGVTDAQVASRLAMAVQAALDGVDAAMSTYKPTSELSQLNEAPVGVQRPVSAELGAVLDVAVEVGEASDGAFDVSVGPLVDAWGFGARRGAAAPPTDAELEQLAAAVGPESFAWQKGVGEGAGAFSRNDARTRVDLSAVAKGYGVDRAAAALLRARQGRFLVEVGGEVVVRGLAPGKRAWMLGVEQPDAAAGAILQAVPMVDVALATSGDYRNFRVVDGKRVSHTIDPRTARPITHALASVSVLAADCAHADAWATALNVLGPEAGLAKATELGLAALLVVRREDGTMDPRPSPAWEQWKQRSESAAAAGQ